jgi:DNA-binding transcriptional MerR regulator
MFTIGEFARLGGVSVRTLHHYDDLGLLTPAFVDPETRYRSYSARQLPRLNRILVLKDLGFSLEEVAGLLAEDLPVAELRGMLRMRERELHIAVEQERSRLEHIRRLLQVIEEDDTMSELEIIIKQVAPIRFACLSVPVPDPPNWETSGPIIRALGPPLHHALRRAGVERTGPRMSFMEGTIDGRFTGRTGAPVDSSVAAIEGLELLDLPPVDVATIVVHLTGTDSDRNTVADRTFRALARWVEDHDSQIAGPMRGLILESDASPTRLRADHVTFEFQMPYDAHD